MSTKKKRRPKQTEIDFPNGWGGVREGAGRKHQGERPGVTHREREALASRFPVLVTLRIGKGLPSLRRKGAWRALMRAFHAANGHRPGFRVNHFSIQTNHLHLIVEAKDRESLARGMQGLSIRIARGLNRLWARAGKVFADRYHDRILRTPSEVRNALAYVLKNCMRHGTHVAMPDVYSSGDWFDGWRGAGGLLHKLTNAPISAARTWLQRAGWRRRGLIDPNSAPGPRAAFT